MKPLFLGSLLLALAACSDGGAQPTSPSAPQQGAPQPMAQNTPRGAAQVSAQKVAARGAPPASMAEAQQALQGLYAIRQQQCQSGNSLACQSLGEFPRHNQRLVQSGQACGAGDPQACAAYNGLSQQIMRAYVESAQVMQAGAQSAAQMDAWRAQMNANHAGNMARLGAQAAAGQAAHQARQEANAAMNESWARGQAAGERNTGRFNDYIYEGTTVTGGGVQTFVPHGSTGYTDRQGNVVVVPDGAQGPAGWQKMDPKYAAPR